MTQPAAAQGSPPRSDVGLRPAAGLGLTLMVTSVLLLTMSDALMKLAMEEVSLSQLLWMRGLVVLAALLGLMVATRRLHVLRVRNRRGMALRCVFMAASTYLFLHGLKQMPIADAYAIAFISPVVAVLLAALFLKELVGWRRWLAVFIGFGGVVLAMLPSGQGYLWTAALFPLGAACCAALRDVTSRRLSVTEASLGILFYAILTVTFCGAIGSLAEPLVAPSTTVLWIVLGSAVLQSTSNFLHIEAFRYAQVSFLMPFRYASLVFAALLGLIVWGDLPTWNVALGSAVIVGSGLFIWWRERQLARSTAAPSPTPSTPDGRPI